MKERPAVAKRFVEAVDEGTALAEGNYAKYRTILPKYTAVKPEQVEIVAQPYLRAWKDLNDVDLASYQAFVNVFPRGRGSKQDFDIKPFILKAQDLAS